MFENNGYLHVYSPVVEADNPRAKNNIYPCKPQFYYIKVGCKGVYITRTCLHDVFLIWIKSEPCKNNCATKQPTKCNCLYHISYGG